MRAKYVLVCHHNGVGVAERWRSQYEKNGSWQNYAGEVSREPEYKALLALGPAPDPDKVDAIIGNNSWTHGMCMSCGEYTRETVLIGEDSYDRREYCRTCIAEAWAALNDGTLP